MKTQSLIIAAVFLTAPAFAQDAEVSEPTESQVRAETAGTIQPSAYDFMDAAKTIKELARDATKGFDRSKYLQQIERRNQQAEKDIRDVVEALAQPSDSTEPAPTELPARTSAQADPSAPAELELESEQPRVASDATDTVTPRDRDLARDVDELVDRMAQLEKRISR